MEYKYVLHISPENKANDFAFKEQHAVCFNKDIGAIMSGNV